MKISNLIEILEDLKKNQGDKEVFVTVDGSFDRLEIKSVDISLVHPGRIIIDTEHEF